MPPARRARRDARTGAARAPGRLLRAPAGLEPPPSDGSRRGHRTAGPAQTGSAPPRGAALAGKRVHNAGDLAAGRGRELGEGEGEPVGAGADRGVDQVDAGGPDGDADLPRPRLRVGHLLGDEHLRRTEFALPDREHGATLALQGDLRSRAAEEGVPLPGHSQYRAPARIRFGGADARRRDARRPARSTAGADGQRGGSAPGSPRQGRGAAPARHRPVPGHVPARPHAAGDPRRVRIARGGRRDGHRRARRGPGDAQARPRRPGLHAAEGRERLRADHGLAGRDGRRRVRRRRRHRHRRLDGLRGPRRGEPQGRALGAGHDLPAARQGDPAAAGQDPPPDRHRDARAPALPRPDRDPRGPPRRRRAHADARRHPLLPRRAGVRGGRDAGPPAGVRRRHGAALHHPPQRARHRDVPAHRPRAAPEAADRGRLREGLRDVPRVPQRGHRHAPQPRVHDARGLPGARGLQGHDGAHRGDGGRRGHGRDRDARDRDRRHARLARAALAPGDDVRAHQGALRHRRAPLHAPRGGAPHRHRGRGGVRGVLGHGEDLQRALRRVRRGQRRGAGVRLRPPARDLAARPAPPRRPHPGGALRGRRGRPRAGQRLQRADRPDRPARALRGRGPGEGRRRPRGRRR